VPRKKYIFNAVVKSVLINVDTECMRLQYNQDHDA